MSSFEKLIRQNRLDDIMSRQLFDATLADFEQIINKGFIKLEAE